MDGPLKILLAEDDPLGNMALRAQIEALGHEVIGAARTGREAVRLAADSPVDLAILDVGMPQMDGIEAATRIFAMSPVAIIILSGYAPEDGDPPAPPASIRLRKPVGLAELRSAISLAHTRLAGWRAEHPNGASGSSGPRKPPDASAADRSQPA